MKIVENKYFAISLILIIIFYLFYSNLIYDYFVAQDTSKYLGLFRDWIITLDDTYCEIQSKNDNCRPYQIGPALLYLPFPNLLKIFYYSYLPNLLIVLFVLSIFLIFHKYYYKNKFLIFCLIFSPTSLFALERGNLDLHLFLLAVLICYNRFFLINLFLISTSFLLKYYPITFFLNIFTDNKKSKVFTISSFFLTVLLSFLIIFYHSEIFIDLFSNLSASKAGYHFIYSIKSFAKILKYLFSFNYIILLIITYLFFIYLTYKFVKLNYKNNLDKIISLTTIEEKLFLIGTNVSLLAYLLFSNIFYREIFLILTIPLLIKFRDELKFIKVFKLIIFFIIFRYLFLHIHNYTLLTENHYHENGIRVFHDSFVFTLAIKSILDYFLMAFLASLVFFQNFKIIRSFFYKF
tara:strand:+ start:1976 stop:3193 length:1218 start_codon:yes stop_codon:yes gene_type:complete